MNEDVLIHRERDTHKYVKRVKLASGKFRYIYPNDLKKKTKQKMLRRDAVEITKTKNGFSKITRDRKLDITKTKLGNKYVHKVKVGNGYRYFYNEESYQRFLKRSEYQKNEPEFMKKIKETSINISESDIIKNCNKLFNSKEPMSFDDFIGYSNNCMNCSTTYELRQRGYDVIAKPIRENDTSGIYSGDSYEETIPNYLNHIYKNPEVKTFDTSEGIITNLKKEPKNSRGNLMVSWKGGSGHSISYEVDSNGNVRLIDGQVNTVYSSDKELQEYIGDKSTGTTYYCRTDNLELKEGVFDAVEVRK